MKEWSECSHKERIERWENAVRVLKNLSPHEKRKHFNMSWWGSKTECGTIACAAGHCGLDPWFRRRGLKMDFYPISFTRMDRTKCTEWGCDFNDDSEVDRFFGSVGTDGIFCKGEQRSVTAVIKEMKEYLKRLKADTQCMEGDENHEYVAECEE